MSFSLEVPGQPDIQEDEVDPSISGNLKKTLSSIEAGVLFMRLAGKQVKGSENIPTPEAITPLPAPIDAKKSKPKHKGKEKKDGNKIQIADVKDGSRMSEDNSHIAGDEASDLYEDMDENALSTFRDLFNMLDQSNTGIITADNLYEELRHVDNEITFSEVEDLLKKVDKDGNGEIDFDEFLYHMTHMGAEGGIEGADDETKKKYTRRQRMFYNAITQFSIKQTLADIEKTFKKQAPHVISHYSAGVRLIGLTTRQLERQMKRMQKNVAKTDSPYAKPLQFVHMGAKKLVHKKKILAKEIPSSTRDLGLEIKKSEPSHTAVADLSQEIKDTMKLFAESGPNVGKLPDANLIMKLRQKIGTVKAQLRSKGTEETDQPTSPVPVLSPVPAQSPVLVPPVTIHIESSQSNPKECVSLTTSPVLLTKPKSASANILISKKKSLQTRGIMSTDKVQATDCEKKKAHVFGQGWTTPRIQYINVPLPSLKMKMKSQKATFNDLHRIRAKAEEATNAYYHNLRQTEIRNAWDHWDRLYADVILPEKLLENFRTVYSAYSPHREEEAFVVCPWKPGPFCYIGHMHNGPVRSLANSPDFKAGHSSSTAKSSLDHLVVQPKSVLQISGPSSRCSSRMT